MESVLKAITKGANLDRVLFTPALKKIYFDMAVASGGATQFKHAETIRKGLSFAADKASDKKNVLLFCAAHELMQSLDQMIECAADLAPVVILALRSGAPESGDANWSYLQLRDTGWLQFYTHTLQETYDHLALAYHLHQVKKIHLPVVVLPSSLNHPALGDWNSRDDLDMGNPMTGLQTSRAEKKMSFEEAFAKMKRKEEKASLAGEYPKITDILREIYTVMNYTLPEKGLPYAGKIPNGDSAILSLIPAETPEDQPRFCRPLCYRPCLWEALLEEFKNKKTLAVVEPNPSIGSSPAFYGEICAQMQNRFTGKILSFTFPSTTTQLTREQLAAIERKIQE